MRKSKPEVHRRNGKHALIVQIAMTVTLALLMGVISLNSVSDEAKQLSGDIQADYDILLDGYVTTFNLLSGQIKEKLTEEPSFDELQEWLQTKEKGFSKQVGNDIYYGIALTYRGGYAHSWNYGDYSDYDPNNRPWYQQAKEAKGDVTIVAPYVTYLDPSYFADDDYIIMTIAQRYTEDISFDYDIKIPEVREMLTQRALQYDNCNILFYDNKGYILSSNAKEQYAHNIRIEDDTIS